MGRSRKLPTDISLSPELSELTSEGHFLEVSIFLQSIPHADDWGRLDAHPVRFKMQVCPGFEVTRNRVLEALERIASLGLWEIYEEEGGTYVSFPQKWWFRYQTYINQSKRTDDAGSDFPAPPSWQKWVLAESGKKQQGSARNSKEVQKGGSRGGKTAKTKTSAAANSKKAPLKKEALPKTAEKCTSPSPSPSPSSEDSVFCEEPKRLTPQQEKFQRVFAAFDDHALARPDASRVASWLKALDIDPLMDLLTQLGLKGLRKGTNYITKVVHNTKNGLRPGAAGRVGGDASRDKALEALS
ncbi:MAG: hypothetical protein K0U98_06145 [Deltaproteobacteria bacterium]|nr:hypothetical protein [Deltaproteobacteria bacterium]